MCINIGGILLVLTLTSYSQAVEELMQGKPKTELKSDGLSDDFIKNRREENKKSDGLSDDFIMNRRQESNKSDGLSDDFIKNRREENKKSDGLSDDFIMNRRQESNKSDGLSDDFIKNRREENKKSDGLSDDFIKNRREENKKSDGLSDDFIMNRRQERNKGHEKKESTFENYLRKFEPSTIWEQIDKQKKYKGFNLSKEEQSAIMFKAMDPTDEIMELKIENGDPKLILDQAGRRQLGWRPHKTQPGYLIDRFYIRNRMYELMKQAIYTTRNKMVIMQIYREKYRNSSLYKMGFLTNKADNAAKTFGKFSFRAYRGCLLAREKVLYRMSIPDLLSVNERQLNLWFNIEILGDLIIENDIIAHKVFKNTTVNRTELFDKWFID